MHGTPGNAARVSRAASITSYSAGVSGTPSRMMAAFSATISGVFMPESTAITFGSEPVKRSAQEASGAPGSAARRISATESGSFTSVPPFTGSMMTTGSPRSWHTS